MRIAVLEAAAALGYVGNSAARALARRRSGWVGVIVGDLDGATTAPALAAFEARLAGEGWALLVAFVGEDASSLEAARALLSQGAEALAFVGVFIPGELAQSRDAQRIPCVAVDRMDGAGFAVGIGLDIAVAGALVVDCLSSLGHRRIALVAAAVSSSGERFGASVRAACAAAVVSLEVLGPADRRLTESFADWSTMPNPPTAAICGSDALAVAVMHACCRIGLEVPSQYSIVGFGDSPLARAVMPMLTSVRIPATDAGVAAADYLLGKFAGIVTERRELPIKLALRGSTGPAPR